MTEEEMKKREEEWDIFIQKERMKNLLHFSSEAFRETLQTSRFFMLSLSIVYGYALTSMLEDPTHLLILPIIGLLLLFVSIGILYSSLKISLGSSTKANSALFIMHSGKADLTDEKVRKKLTEVRKENEVYTERVHNLLKIGNYTMWTSASILLFTYVLVYVGQFQIISQSICGK